jgi:hypothetical protein
MYEVQWPQGQAGSLCHHVLACSVAYSRIYLMGTKGPVSVGKAGHFILYNAEDYIKYSCTSVPPGVVLSNLGNFTLKFRYTAQDLSTTNITVPWSSYRFIMWSSVHATHVTLNTSLSSHESIRFGLQRFLRNAKWKLYSILFCNITLKGS